jgi:hypothetical protein
MRWKRFYDCHGPFLCVWNSLSDGRLNEIVIQISVIAFCRCPLDKRGAVRNTTMSLTARFMAHFGTAAAMHRSGGHPCLP